MEFVVIFFPIKTIVYYILSRTLIKLRIIFFTKKEKKKLKVIKTNRKKQSPTSNFSSKMLTKQKIKRANKFTNLSDNQDENDKSTKTDNTSQMHSEVRSNSEEEGEIKDESPSSLSNSNKENQNT